ncbi:hypothetical protein [Massilia psychrophila]|uniref:hypothetical protein n=1 Tax=Massilia psychrophila TaxID=1603353 RepID=UPI00117D9D2E|nr:hypothetical protein [Massilia psychrophila]
MPLFLSSIGALAGCSHVIAQTKSRDQFIATAANPDVRYLPGSQVLADRLAAKIGHSIEVVEQAHGVKFTHPPRVFVCTTECVVAFVLGNNKDPATQSGDSIFMNEDLILQREQHRGVPADGFLTHELAHLLLYQRAGIIAYLRVPAWFKEGVAVMTSDGAGLSATPAEAAQSILDGKSFDPAESGSVFRNRTAASYDLRAPIFYQEAALFVWYLNDKNPTAFKLALKGILNGDDFQESFGQAYGQSISSQWPGFLVSMRQLVAER